MMYDNLKYIYIIFFFLPPPQELPLWEPNGWCNAVHLFISEYSPAAFSAASRLEVVEGIPENTAKDALE